MNEVGEINEVADQGVAADARRDEDEDVMLSK